MNYFGGLVGRLSAGTIDNSFALGNAHINDAYYADGGLVGGLTISGDITISNSYSEINIIANIVEDTSHNAPSYQNIGGLIGHASSGSEYSLTINNSYGQSYYANLDNTDCLIGKNESTALLSITNSVCDSDSKENRSGDFYQALGWDFTNTWEINEGLSSPALQGFNAYLQR